MATASTAPTGRYPPSTDAQPIGAATVAWAGLKCECVAPDGERLALELRATATEAACPLCGRFSTRMHSGYSIKIADLPRHGTPVVLRIRARKFFCDDPSCERRIFCERGCWQPEHGLWSVSTRGRFVSPRIRQSPDFVARSGECRNRTPSRLLLSVERRQALGLSLTAKSRRLYNAPGAGSRG